MHSVGNKSLVFFSTMCTVSVFAVQNIHKHEQVTKIEVAVTLWVALMDLQDLNLHFSLRLLFLHSYLSHLAASLYTFA